MKPAILLIRPASTGSPAAVARAYRPAVSSAGGCR